VRYIFSSSFYHRFSFLIQHLRSLSALDFSFSFSSSYTSTSENGQVIVVKKEVGVKIKPKREFGDQKIKRKKMI
jgi:hypothetical protein